MTASRRTPGIQHAVREARLERTTSEGDVVTEVRRDTRQWPVPQAGWYASVLTDDGTRLILSHLDGEPRERWVIDGAFAPNGVPLHCHGFGSRVTLLRVMDPGELTDLLDHLTGLDRAVSLEHDHCGADVPHRPHPIGNVLCHGTTIDQANACERCGTGPADTWYAGTGQDLCWGCLDLARAAIDAAWSFGQEASRLHQHLLGGHGQEQVSLDEAEDLFFLRSLHTVVREQNPHEVTAACDSADPGGSALVRGVVSALRRGTWFILEATPYGTGMVAPCRSDVLEAIETLTY